MRDLAHELNFPIASLYRRVRALQIAGVLHAEKIKDSNSGKETMVYSSLIQKLQIKFGDAEPQIELGFKEGMEPTAMDDEKTPLPPVPTTWNA
ncbi:MAG: hypothetical protein ACYDCK_09840 [Thermoplasmatota archaeon]